MTCLAYDGFILAADKRAVSGGGIARQTTKIERFEDRVLGITGDWDAAAEMREWYKEGADPTKFPAKARDDKATLVVIHMGSIRSIKQYNAGPYPMSIENTRCAWGSGRDYAEAVMYLGYNSVRAVQVACHFQTDCGDGVDFLEVNPNVDGIKKE